MGAECDFVIGGCETVPEQGGNQEKAAILICEQESGRIMLMDHAAAGETHSSGESTAVKREAHDSRLSVARACPRTVCINLLAHFSHTALDVRSITQATVHSLQIRPGQLVRARRLACTSVQHNQSVHLVSTDVHRLNISAQLQPRCVA